tara:strand:- start:462 stop:635 length:174 start_codon:yes stop_codon:yes gene_type:complete
MVAEDVAKQVVDQWGSVRARTVQINVDQLLCLANAILKDTQPVNNKKQKTKPETPNQ